VTDEGSDARARGAIEAVLHEYTRRYVARDIEGVVQLCVAPFLAIRDGRAIPLPDAAALRDHFATVIEGYTRAGFAGFGPVELDTRLLGEHAAFTTVRWHAFDADGKVVRDTKTTYHLLRTEHGWRFLSYTNHF
jgi:hypothetical protein